MGSSLIEIDGSQQEVYEHLISTLNPVALGPLRVGSRFRIGDAGHEFTVQAMDPPAKLAFTPEGSDLVSSWFIVGIGSRSLVAWWLSFDIPNLDGMLENLKLTFDARRHR